jgi:hypothetical protein
MAFIMGKAVAVFGEVACCRDGGEGLRVGRPSGFCPILPFAAARLPEWIRRSRIPEKINKAALMGQEHCQKLLVFACTSFSAAAAALNDFIPTAERKSRGYRRPRHFRAIIFPPGENLPGNLPAPFPPPPLYPQQTPLRCK